MTSTQHTIHGEGMAKGIASLIAEAGHTSVFVVLGNHLSDHINEYIGSAAETHTYVKAGTSVDEREIEMAYEAFALTRATCILAIGGGSVIDLAKGIIFGCINEGKTIPYFLVAPTTAGSGSEATHFAVVYRNNKKISLAHASLQPAMVVLDPELTYSLPADITATCGIDVVSQAVESHWGIHADKYSRQLAEECIGLWIESYLNAVQAPGPAPRAAMMRAANLSGAAINLTRTTGPHALSYYLTATFNIPHGQAVGIFLPIFFLYNAPLPRLCELLGVMDEKAAMDLIRNKMRTAGLMTTLSDLGVDKHQHIDALLDSVNEERFANNPIPFDRPRLRQLILEHL